MEIILLERVEKLGQMGDVVRVKDGFARNYLLPQRKALRATKSNKERFEKERIHLEATNLKLRQEAEAAAKKMEGVTVTLLRQASEAAQLYGSVSARDIAEAVTAAGFSVARHQVLLQQPIKALGIHQVRVALHPEVAITASVNVARSAAEAEAQAGGGEVAPEQFFEDAALAPQAEPEEDESDKD
ncbi:MAG TPA: 50S ribosomal protein L9 [Candidatus Cybelea sp.]|nr:50S ribosomal protein L9 [Candidatus Cybelea sp.]